MSAVPPGPERDRILALDPVEMLETIGLRADEAITAMLEEDEGDLRRAVETIARLARDMEALVNTW